MDLIKAVLFPVLLLFSMKLVLILIESSANLNVSCYRDCQYWVLVSALSQ